MPEICENWLGLVNIYIYFAHQTHEICQILPYSVDFKASGGFEIRIKQYLVNVVLFGIYQRFRNCHARRHRPIETQKGLIS